MTASARAKALMDAGMAAYRYDKDGGAATVALARRYPGKRLYVVTEAMLPLRGWSEFTTSHALPIPDHGDLSPLEPR